MLRISRRDFLRGSLASAAGLGIFGLPLKSRASTTVFDYIVIGAGAAGCVVANRLSADGNTKVLLLEAGSLGPLAEHPDPAIAQLDLLSLLSLWQPGYLEWGFYTAPERGANGRSIQLLAGKVLGGGTTINGRIFLRGNRRDFDHWSDLGNAGWSYEEVLPYFKKLETYMGPHPSDLRGEDGPVPTIRVPTNTPAASRFVDAAAEQGFGHDWDLNGFEQEGGAGYPDSNVFPDSLTRADMANVYVRPLLGQSNFTLQTGALTTRVLFEGHQAVGVEYWQDGTIYQARATSEVIVSAGTYNTPKLLMLSGIGPAWHLQSHGIPVVANLPGVGRNLQDHLLCLLVFASRTPQLPATLILTEASLFTHLFNDPEAASPDLQLYFGGFKFVPPFEEGMTLVPVVGQPKSMGSVTLRSSYPLDRPVIRHNYLTTEQDMRVLLEGLALGRELFHTRAFDDMRGEELSPGANVRSQKDLREYIRNTCLTSWHPTSSCMMGHGRMAVVDPQLRVYGVTGLRVVDASIMPSIVSGNIAATCIMIGERGADMILASQGAWEAAAKTNTHVSL